MAAKLVLVAVLVHAACAARVQDLDLRSDEEMMTYEDHVTDFLRSVLEGTWNTDYLTKDPVRITSLAGENPDFVHGTDAVLDHYRAECAHFGAGHGVRFLTVSKTLELNAEPGAPVAVITQRVDRSQSVRHVGKLFLEEDGDERRWVLEWDHSRPGSDSNHRWWRSAVDADDAPKVEPDGEDNAERAQRLSLALVQQWDEDCRQGLTGLIEFSATVAVSVSVGPATGGVAATLTGSIGLSVATVKRHKDRIICMVKKMDAFAKEKNGVEGRGDQSRLKQGLKFLSVYQEDMDVTCLPGLSLSLSFSVVPYPPYVWPVPSVGFGMSWAKSLADIRVCIGAADLGEIVTEAQGAKPAEDDLDGTADEVRDKGSSRALSLSATLSQGPSFGLFPPSIGWVWGMELSLAISTRRLIKGAREITCGGSFCRTRCELDKEELYVNTASWAKATKKLIDARSSSCGRVMSTFASIRAERGAKFDPETNPFTAVPYLEQLGSEDGRRADSRSFNLGGGIAYVGTDCIKVGIFKTFSASSSRDHDYEHECSEYAEFVNIYRKQVEPALADVDTSCPRSDRVDVRALPPMNYHSCSSVALGSGPEFPDALTPKNVVSQCESCLRVSSFGMPCSFCGGLISNDCRQFFGSSKLKPCFGGSAAMTLDNFDPSRRGVSDAVTARKLCLEAGRRKAGATPAEPSGR